jgi:CHAT domain-containing protein
MRPAVVRAVAIVVSCALPLLAAGAQPRPRALEREAALARERGDAATLRARWAARLERERGDREARFGIAALDELEYRHDAAIAGYRAVSGATPADGLAAYARLAWARMDELRGRMGDARAGYDSTRLLARRAGDRETDGLALLSLAFLRANAEGIESGMATLDSAERLLPDDAAVRADAARRRATLLAVQLDPRARAVADEAVRLARASGDRRMEANAVRALALEHKMRGHADSSWAALDEVARLQRLARDDRALSETLIRIADLHITERRLGEARALLLEAERLARASRNEFALASAATGLGAVALRVRDLAAAHEHLAQAAALNVAAGDSASLVVVRGLQGVAAFEAGLLDTAWALRLGVLRAYEASNEIPDAVASRRSLATISLARGDLSTAHRELDAAEALVRRHRVPALAPPLWYDRARVRVREGRDADAAALLERYRAGLRADDLVARWDVEVLLAGIRARAGDARGAARALAAASTALERWRAQQGDSVLRLLAFQVAAHEGAPNGGDFARAIAAIAAGGAVAEAFDLAERQRARTLAERLAEARLLRAPGAAATTARRDAALPPMSSDAIRGALPGDDVALVELVTGRERAPTTAFVVTRAGVRAVALPDADALVPSLRRLLALVEGGDDATALRRQLADSVLLPVLAALDARVARLVVVPDGALHRVPWDALALGDGRPAIERYEVSLAPSATIAAALWLRPTSSRAARVLAVGDPARPPSGSALDSLGALPEARREARAVAAYGRDSRALVGSAASAASLRRQPLDSFSVLHFATHAVVDERSLLRSAILLSPGDGDDGALGPGDLATLPLDADLVVLSSCRSGSGVVVDGEGVQGLTAPLLAAGSRAIVASNWAVDDRETRLLVEDLYRALADGESLGGALRRAKLASLRRGRPPRDWAALVVVGDAGGRVPLEAPAPRLWLAGLVGACVLLPAVWAASRRRRR